MHKKPIKSILSLLAALALLCGLFALPASAAVNTSGFAAEVVRLVNVERGKVGASPLQFGNKALNDATMTRAKETVSLFSHTRPNGSEPQTVLDEHHLYAGALWSKFGENIAYGQDSPAEVVADWMDSPGHKRNILDAEFNWIGVAVCENPDGRLYWAQLFLKSNAINSTGDTDPAGSIIPVLVTTTTLPGGTVGTAYGQTLSVSGAAPITWALDSGALPGGLTLSSAGVISGTPTADGTFTFSVKATNTAGNHTKTLSIKIGAAKANAINTIFGTDYPANPLNWILFFLGFGWIWMWF